MVVFTTSCAETLTLMAHLRIFLKMDRNQGDAQVQLEACIALGNLAMNDANKVTLVAAGAHVRIIRAMDRHHDDARVQETEIGRAHV